MAVDWELVAALAVLSAFEGLRRIPAGAVVLVWGLDGRWRPRKGLQAGRGWSIVAWWPPLGVPLVLPPSDPEAQYEPIADAGHVVMARLQAVGRPALVLRVLGTAELVCLVLALPALSAEYGPGGFVLSATVVIVLCAANAVVLVWALGRTDARWPERFRAAAAAAWPLSAGRASEILLSAAVHGFPAGVVVQQLVEPDDFRSWLRPRAYDALERPDVTPEADLLLRTFGRTTLVDIVQGPPAALAADELYCPRCAGTYVASVAMCRECEVALRSAMVTAPGAKGGDTAAAQLAL